MLRRVFPMRLRAIVPVLLLLLGAALPVAAQTPADLRGDVDGDGAVTAADALAVLSSLVEKPLPDGYRLGLVADADGNGRMTAADALVILASVVGKDVSAYPVGRGITDWARLDTAAVLVDSTATVVLADSADPSGTMKVLFRGQAPAITVGKVLLGTQNGGFLRRVTAVRTRGDTLVVDTEQASLEDAIEGGTLRTTINFSPGTLPVASAPGLVFGRPVTGYMAPGLSVAPTGGFNFSGVELAYDAAGVSVKITEGSYQMDASVDVDATWGDGGLQDAHVIFNAPMRTALGVEVQYKANTENAVKPVQKTIFESRYPFAGAIGFVPVAGYVSIRLVAEAKWNIEGAGTFTGGFREVATLRAGARYRNDAPEGIFNYDATHTIIPVRFGVQGSNSVTVTLRPVVAVRFYGVAGPFVEAPGWARLGQSVTVATSPLTGTWKQELVAGVDGKIGGSFDIFTRRIASLSYTLEGPRWVLWADSGSVGRDSVAISPETAGPLTQGDTVRLAAQVRNALGYVEPDAKVTWRSANAFLSVDSTGLVRAVAAGPGMVIADYREASDTLEIEVGLPTVSIIPDTVFLTTGGYVPLRLTARVADAAGREIPGALVEWASGRPSHLLVDAAGNLTGLQAGDATVQARYSPSESLSVAATAPVDIRDARVVIGDAQGAPFPGDSVPTLTVGFGGQRLTATAYDHENRAIQGARFTWYSHNAASIRVDSTGLATAVHDGGARVTVNLLSRDQPGVAGTHDITLLSGQPTVVVSPDSTTPALTVGFDTLQLSAAGYDVQGRPLPTARFRWSTNDFNVLTVDSAGLVRTTREPGANYIIATMWSEDGMAPAVRGQVLLTTVNATVNIVQDSVPLLTTGMDTYQLSAEAFDAHGQQIPGARFGWTVSDGSALAVDSTGHVRTVHHATTARVRVTLRPADDVGGLDVFDEIDVTNQLPTLDVRPNHVPELDVGQAVQLTATVYDARGQVRSVPVVWSSGTTVYVTVTQTGFARAVGGKGASDVGAVFLAEDGWGLAIDHTLIGVKEPPPPPTP